MPAPRYAILLHRQGEGDHWDFLLEKDEALTAWRLLADPLAASPGAVIPAEKLPDHRKLYLSYEGPVSGDRGEVRRVAEGTYELLAADEACWRVRLAGRLSGEYRLEAKQPGDQRWTFRAVSGGGASPSGDAPP